MGVYVLSQYLLAKDNILDMVKEKKFLKLKHHVYLNNFDRFDEKMRKLALQKIVKDQVPSTTSDRIILMYYTDIGLTKDEHKLEFTPGAISIQKMK